MTKNILEVDSVQKQYDGKIIVSDVYLKCETTDIIGVLGRNGSGKSTLLKIIFGIVVIICIPLESMMPKDVFV